ncbi:MAG: murein L,D-transpeptidase [Bacteroidetes bacterium B1(2017)]|nr:MAG: murein L,D-transpeptidase [Bacteroidetes bacterium B1(2017)]
MEVYFTYILNLKTEKYFLKQKNVFFKLFTFTFLICLLFSFALMSCGKNKAANKGILPDTSIYSNQNFSEKILDSTILADFYLQYHTEDSLQTQITEFYKRRNYQYAWFDKNGITEACHIFYNQLQNFSSDFDDQSINTKLIDSLINIAHKEDKNTILPESETHKIEFLLTSNFFQYAEKSFGGIAKNTYDLEWFIPRKKKNFQSLLDSIISTSNNSNLQYPVNQYYKTLTIELRNYKAIEKSGGFPGITTLKKQISVGESDSCLVNLKRYLLITGDLKTKDTTMIFDENLKTAIISFQNRFGLTESGILNKATLNELNTPIKERIQQIMINLERLRWLPEEMEPNFLMVNIPEFKLHIFENGKPISESKVVVGKMATKTSIFKGQLSTVVLNPYWGLPNSIVINEVLPKIKSNVSYLSRNNIEVFSKNSIIDPRTVNWSQYKTQVPYNFRQKPGKNNSLGKIKFLFPNNYNIYLHDTPSKSLFTETNRSFSHGCIRVENPKNLAEYILRNDTQWNIEHIEKILKTDIEKRITVKPTIPVYLLYLTSWVNHRGKLNFRKDIYLHDKKLASEIFAKEK